MSSVQLRRRSADNEGNCRNPPSHLLEVGKQTHEFFNITPDAYGRNTYKLKPMHQYSMEHRTDEQPSKQYFKQTKLKDVIMEYPYAKRNVKQNDIDKGEFLGFGEANHG